MSRELNEALSSVRKEQQRLEGLVKALQVAASSEVAVQEAAAQVAKVQEKRDALQAEVDALAKQVDECKAEVQSRLAQVRSLLG